MGLGRPLVLPLLLPTAPKPGHSHLSSCRLLKERVWLVLRNSQVTIVAVLTHLNQAAPAGPRHCPMQVDLACPWEWEVEGSARSRAGQSIAEANEPLKLAVHVGYGGRGGAILQTNTHVPRHMSTSVPTAWQRSWVSVLVFSSFP